MPRERSLSPHGHEQHSSLLDRVYESDMDGSVRRKLERLSYLCSISRRRKRAIANSTTTKEQ